MARSENDSRRRKRRGERADGRILVTLVIGYQPDGKPKRKYFYGRSRQEAERKRNEYVRLQEQGFTADADSMTVNDWIDEWLRRYKSRLEAAYAVSFGYHVNRLRDALGDRLIRGVVEADLQESLDSIADMSASTITKYHSVICQVFSTARRNKIIRDDPSEYLDVPDGYAGSHRALERWEIDTIMANWDKHRAGLWAMLMLLCGLRRSEMIALDWRNVDLEHRQLHVREAAVVLKNQTYVKDRAKSPAGIRSLPISDPLYAALCAVPPERRVGQVCLSVQGKRLTESGFNRGWHGFCLAMQRICNGEDLDQRGRRKRLETRIAEAEAKGRQYVLFRVRSHDLRHTFATALFEAGVEPKAAQYYLGHSSIKMTLDLYTHLTKEYENRKRSELTGFLDEWYNELGNEGRRPEKDE